MSNRKPTKIKEISGTLRKSRQKNEPKPVVCLPTPPEWLAGEALSEWERVTAELEPLGYLTRADRGVLVAYCLLWGELAASARGEKPLLAALVAQLRAAASSLGLDPVSRGKIDIKLPEKEAENNFWGGYER